MAGEQVSFPWLQAQIGRVCLPHRSRLVYFVVVDFSVIDKVCGEIPEG